VSSGRSTMKLMKTSLKVPKG